MRLSAIRTLTAAQPPFAIVAIRSEVVHPEVSWCFDGPARRLRGMSLLNCRTGFAGHCPQMLVSDPAASGGRADGVLCFRTSHDLPAFDGHSWKAPARNVSSVLRLTDSGRIRRTQGRQPVMHRGDRSELPAHFGLMLTRLAESAESRRFPQAMVPAPL